MMATRTSRVDRGEPAAAGPMAEGGRDFDFTSADFERIRALIHRRAGIALSDHKRDMAYSRLARRLRALGLDSFRDYLDQLESRNDADEWEAFTNALTTNLTAFFREAHHFPILAEFVKRRPQPVSVWCSAASTGEEPYSIAMTLIEALGDHAARQATVLATDLDTQVLAKGQAGVYAYDQVKHLSPERLKRFFLRGTGQNSGLVKVRPELRAMIRFEQLNLTDADYGLRTQFDAIFCRNVMIYFDKPTQGQVLARFEPLMKPDGLLFAGHSENFTYVTQAFRLRGQTVYELTGARASRPATTARAHDASGVTA
ncbi:CheR family methyltransferase [Paraburkholderia caballeronis]|uniref:Chemotaxis protein methyltransferase n=1 Tax=Paraburkholderia caballeronis TaxID=416943 RepID=A0A1H7SMP1_9BURK|nr:CheR family methyltransferase [Paraburkholderia caballeronis]PXW22392.1 CheR-type MCP methyltransferase [Paraburkholderia caballeronis]PXW96050.1 CheR-type MCP methyltransferase [Paraburkholderia caballeronis]RAJ92416.1 CheR-type MCP methyltransferase [Paraburkholderia caballeronis]SEB49801.1 MCP methyltransferase, CheR-type [Paraburkholderia caballeronis]SEL73783.1 MCP methyltransferase, CheR-type [Paraburkholderia caballeronis]